MRPPRPDGPPHTAGARDVPPDAFAALASAGAGGADAPGKPWDGGRRSGHGAEAARRARYSGNAPSTSAPAPIASAYFICSSMWAGGLA